MIKTFSLPESKKIYTTDLVSEYESLLTKGLCVVPEYFYTDKDELSDVDKEGYPWPHTNYIVTEPEEMSTRDLCRIYQRINNLPWHILSTKHFIIRESTVDDVESFYRIYSEDGITDYIEPLFEDIQNEMLYMRNYIKDIYAFYGFGMWSVVDSITHDIIGRAGISMIDGYEYPELGFVTATAYQHQGYTFEILSAIMEYAKNELGFSKIQARVKPSNIKSINLLTRLGFNIPHTPQQDYLIALHTFS